MEDLLIFHLSEFFSSIGAGIDENGFFNHHLLEKELIGTYTIGQGICQNIITNYYCYNFQNH